MSEYRVWECQICGWIYDEAKGWPEDGIAPGTRWEDIPEDWSCPQCGAAKQDFRMIQLSGSSAPEPLRDSPAPGPSAPAAPSTIATTGYRIWECMVCGWVYDESKGWPEDGIAPGTRWEDIPEDWSCPQCGVSKGEFDMVLVSGETTGEQPAPAIDSSAEPLVIVGTGLAGYNLAREFRKLDKSRPLVLITADDGSCYSKPLLSTSLAHGKTSRQLADASAEEMARELNAEILVHTRVRRIHREARSLELTPQNDGQPAFLRYAQLVLATGASPTKLPAIEGDGLARLFRINNLGDYHRFRTALINRRRVLLIGAGLIGCEFANDLVQAGFEVAMVDPLDWPLASLLPEAAGRDLQQALEAAGVTFHGNRKVCQLESSGSGLRATLDRGEVLEADIALAALGLQANTLLAEDAGIGIGRAVRVNRQLRTDDANIFALGDCAEVDGHQLCFVAPLISCARALAKTLAGSPTPVCYGTLPVAVKTTVHPVTLCPPQESAEGSWQWQPHAAGGVRAEFRGSGGQLLGFALTGNAITLRESLASECEPLMAD
ncbi:FAD-dependent oxidoreductase [Microbulbifer sp. 2201CG32-9]|uniref:FAD-dependent oxidoreductase n=1 Tax=Microbulbifer sp. 2201CG32-9 TaxID=3232309 RepID=UPI00345B5A19